MKKKAKSTDPEVKGVRESLEDKIKVYYGFSCPTISKEDIERRNAIGNEITELQFKHYKLVGSFYQYKHHPVTERKY